MFVFELSGPKLVPILNFSSISLKMADFSLFLGAKYCDNNNNNNKNRSHTQLDSRKQVIAFQDIGTFCNFVAMATAPDSTNWFDLQNVLKVYL